MTYHNSNSQRRQRRINKRFIPNLVTVFNMFLGFMAIGQLILGEPVRAGWLILIAGLLDAVDGKIARLIGIPSKFGTEFDSLADTISFCVAPSVLLYRLYIDGLPPMVGGMLAFIPLMMGTIRLAKFNLVEGPQSHFTGLTTPINALLIFGYMLFNHQIYGHFGDPRIALAMTIILGFLMISPVRFSKVPLLSLQRGRNNTLQLIGVAGTFIAMIIWKGIVLFPLLVVYTTWNIVKWLVHPALREDLDDYPTLHEDD